MKKTTSNLGVGITQNESDSKIHINELMANQDIASREKLESMIPEVVYGTSMFQTPTSGMAALYAVGGGLERQTNNAARMMGGLSPDASPELIKATAMIANEGIEAFQDQQMLAFKAINNEQTLTARTGIALKAYDEVGRAATTLGSTGMVKTGFLRGIYDKITGAAKDAQSNV